MLGRLRFYLRSRGHFGIVAAIQIHRDGGFSAGFRVSSCEFQELREGPVRLEPIRSARDGVAQSASRRPR